MPGRAAVNACCDVVNRGVAVWKGKVYVASVDGRLHAISAATGKKIWEYKEVRSNHYAAGILSTDGGIVWQPSVNVPAVAIAGLAGAGDALAAGVLYGIHEDWPMARSLRLGVCTAAASLYHPTCSESVRPVDECLALGDQLGFRQPPP